MNILGYILLGLYVAIAIAVLIVGLGMSAWLAWYSWNIGLAAFVILSPIWAMFPLFALGLVGKIK